MQILIHCRTNADRSVPHTGENFHIDRPLISDIPQGFAKRFPSHISSLKRCQVQIPDTGEAEAGDRVKVSFQSYEEDGIVHVRIGFFYEPEAPLAAYEVFIRLDAVSADWADAARAASDWI